jgi:hypothetical protein
MFTKIGLLILGVQYEFGLFHKRFLGTAFAPTGEKQREAEEVHAAELHNSTLH